MQAVQNLFLLFLYSRSMYQMLIATSTPPSILSSMAISHRLSISISVDFPHARIDLYNVDGKIYFGEITYYCSSGYCPFEPDSFDFELGESFKEYS